jgi:small subunit ribosomal protein S6
MADAADARRYEILLLLDPRTEGDREEQILTRARELIEGQGGTDVTTVPWGRKRLAYTVDKQDEGIYVVITFTATPAALAEVERILRITDGVMRHVAVLVSPRVKQAPVPGPETPDPADATPRESDRRAQRA